MIQYSNKDNFNRKYWIILVTGPSINYVLKLKALTTLKRMKKLTLFTCVLKRKKLVIYKTQKWISKTGAVSHISQEENWVGVRINQRVWGRPLQVTQGSDWLCQ